MGQSEHEFDGLLVGAVLLAGEGAPGVEAECERDCGAELFASWAFCGQGSRRMVVACCQCWW